MKNILRKGKMEQVYADMLREIGIEVDPADIVKSVDAYVDAEEKPKTSAWQPPEMVIGYQHMTHVVRDRPFVPYKRATHFQHHLDQHLGRNYTPGVCELVLGVLKRARVNAGHKMAYFRARKVLKRAGYSSVEYRKIFWALREMGGPVVKISWETEERIKADFMGLTEMFEKNKPQGRKNFPSYYLIMELLFSKYGIKFHYVMLGIKDGKKFRALVEMYSSMR